MKLKRVRIQGFKTFADRTEFDLDGDIIAVVGPNGCGKSNIVDSILWGLGESNSRQLRAQTGKEVIFAGSTHRKPIGFCEVTLLFDNEDGALPLDSAEVSITRRLTRAGDSDYQINRRSCRLRDVNDLLADSGLGRAGYAIVGQSEIDQALAASAQQRRGWIDEAAGVQRYRARRTEALRRLASADDHLVRVQDIVAEIELQREPLEAEALVAKEYKLALSSLREVECGLLSKELAAAVAELEILRVRIEDATRTLEENSARATGLETEGQELATRLQELDARTEALRERQQRAQIALEQANANFQIAEHKLASLDYLETTLTEETASDAVRKAQAAEELEKARKESASEEESREALHRDLVGVDAEAIKFDKELKELDSELAKAREALTHRQRLEVEMAHRDQRLKQIAVELKGIVGTLPDLEAAILEAETEFERLEAESKAHGEAKALAEKRLNKVREQEELHAQQNRQLLAKLATLEGRRRGIEATLEAHDGLAQGPKAVLKAVSDGVLPPEFEPVGTAIDVEPALAVAFDIALGHAANDLIVPDDSYAKEAIRYLKDNRLGRATFQPINLMRPSHVSAELKRVLQQPGVVGLASDLVGCPDRIRPVIESLLGRVVLTETLDDSLRLAKTTGWSRMVTLDGEVVHSSGAVTGGASLRQGTGLVQRRSELTEIETQIKELQASMAKESKLVNVRETERVQATELRAAAETAIAEQALALEEARAWLLNLKHEHTSTVKSQQKLVAESEQLRDIPSLPAVDVNVAELEAKRDATMRLLAERTSDASNVAIRLEEANLRRDQAASRLHDAERRLKNLIEMETARGRRSENLGPDREKYAALMDESQKTRVALSAEVDELREDLRLALEAKKLLQAEALRLNQEAKDAQRASGLAADQAHQCELKRARYDSQRSSVVQRLLEEYGVTAEDALAQAPTVEIPADSGTVVAQLRRQIKAMGDVNLGAVEAFERLTQRHDELVHQIEDIESGKAEISNSIAELDRLTKDRFQTTFEKLQVRFASSFQKIFGGGEGALELTDSGNILDSGVDIQVTVPGKRRQRLELLSGGERAMSAIAFLFALLQVKPTPLVILDEVDAPLDGRNVERFIQVMRDFSAQTQFILITHNPVTIESADVWFGVTMQEPGVSTLVPFKVPERSLIKAVVPDAYLKG